MLIFVVLVFGILFDEFFPAAAPLECLVETRIKLPGVIGFALFFFFNEVERKVDFGASRLFEVSFDFISDPSTLEGLGVFSML